MKIRLLLLAILCFCLIGVAAPKRKVKPIPPSDGEITLNARDWKIRYYQFNDWRKKVRYISPIQIDGGWYFDFPNGDPPGCVGYAYYQYNASLLDKSAITWTAEIAVTGDPDFRYDTNVNNTCIFPAHARLHLERTDMDWMDGYHRWWSNPIALELQEGIATLTTTLDPSQWSGVWGEFGDESPEALDGFYDCLGNIGQLGLSFGGGCYFGHGVYVPASTGTAKFILTDFGVQ